MHYWQVRKYPPLEQHQINKPKIPTWTSIVDIGQTFQGILFNEDEYLLTEDRHVEAVKIYMRSVQVQELEIHLFDKLREEIFLEHAKRYPKCYSCELTDFYYLLEHGLTISGKQVEWIIRLGMREAISCQLRNRDLFFLNFSYDYYMDIGSTIICENAVKEIRHLGLYIDPWDGPYEVNVWSED
ncbi:hypothetical protein D3C77_509120 [compost metagenome]